MRSILSTCVTLAVTLLMGVCSVNASNLVINGDFAAGNSGFASSYLFPAAPGGNLDAGEYAIGPDPSAYHVLFGSFGAPGGGN